MAGHSGSYIIFYLLAWSISKDKKEVKELTWSGQINMKIKEPETGISWFLIYFIILYVIIWTVIREIENKETGNRPDNI